MDKDVEMSNWMQMPIVPNQPPKKVQKQGSLQDVSSTSATSASTASMNTVKGKGSGLKGKGSGKTQGKLIRAAVNLDTRLRAVEGIVSDALEVPDTTTPAVAACDIGSVYQDTVAAKGRGHNLGPPHLRVWAEFIRKLKIEPGLPIELSYASSEHVHSLSDTLR